MTADIASKHRDATLNYGVDLLGGEGEAAGGGEEGDAMEVEVAGGGGGEDQLGGRWKGDIEIFGKIGCNGIIGRIGCNEIIGRLGRLGRLG